MSSLYLACAKGEAVVVANLIDQGFDVNAKELVRACNLYFVYLILSNGYADIVSVEWR